MGACTMYAALMIARHGADQRRAQEAEAQRREEAAREQALNRKRRMDACVRMRDQARRG